MRAQNIASQPITCTDPVAVEKPGLLYEMSDEPGPAGVVINQVELNPVKTGGIASNQWVKLYNTGSSEVDISGWNINSTRPASPHFGLTAHILPGTKIPSKGYYLIETPDLGEDWNWLTRTDEVLTLRDAQGRLVDWTPELTDDKYEGTAETWQYLPEGRKTRSLSNWIFR